MYHQYREGYIEVICGCMFAGKTEELIRRINVLSYAKQKILVFKPKIDDRYSEIEIASHSGRDLIKHLSILTPISSVIAPSSFLSSTFSISSLKAL